MLETALDFDAAISLAMAVIFLAGLVGLFLPSTEGGNGLRPHLIAIFLISVIFFMASTYPLIFDDVLNHLETVTWLVWIRAGSRLALGAAIIILSYKLVRHG